MIWTLIQVYFVWVIVCPILVIAGLCLAAFVVISIQEIAKKFKKKKRRK